VSEEENRAIFAHPLAMTCSDGSVLPEEGDFRPHPRNYRSFVKPLYDFVARRRLLTFEEAIRKATSMPAQKIGLFDRGILRPGMKADIALMDVPALGCDATYDAPRRYARGVEYLLVDGVPAVEGGRFTGALNGKLLRRRGSARP
jgi:N-acyl-D-aspartate/D-glutamate deacylase